MFLLHLEFTFSFGSYFYNLPLKEIRKNIINNSDDRYTYIEELGYINIINGYIMRLEEERRKILTEKNN